MRKTAIIPAWGRILRGFRPFLSIEITKECPLKCPGCYAYEPGHLNDGRSIVSLTEWRGEELVERVLGLVRRFRPLHVSIVGGEPLIRYRELTCLIREFNTMGIEVQVVTSAVRPIPAEWAEFPNLHLVVSVDGLQPEHDARRTPATYDRILRHIDGHRITVHCTVVPQFLARVDYLRDFARFWSLHSRRSEDLVQPVHAADRGPLSSAAHSRGPRDRDRSNRRAPIPVPQGICTGSGPQRLPSSARLAIRVHICANHKLRLG